MGRFVYNEKTRRFEDSEATSGRFTYDEKSGKFVDNGPSSQYAEKEKPAPTIQYYASDRSRMERSVNSSPAGLLASNTTRSQMPSLTDATRYKPRNQAIPVQTALNRQKQLRADAANAIDQGSSQYMDDDEALRRYVEETGYRPTGANWANTNTPALDVRRAITGENTGTPGTVAGPEEGTPEYMQLAIEQLRNSPQAKKALYQPELVNRYKDALANLDPNADDWNERSQEYLDALYEVNKQGGIEKIADKDSMDPNDYYNMLYNPYVQDNWKENIAYNGVDPARNQTIYEAVNDPGNYTVLPPVNSLGALSLGTEGFDNFSIDAMQYMSDEQKDIYNYIYNTQGSEQANDYIRDILPTLTPMQRERIENELAVAAKDYQVLMSLGSIAAAPLKTITYVNQIADFVKDGKIDQNAGYNFFSYMPSTVRQSVAEGLGGVGGFLYQSGMSMFDFLTQAALTGNFSGLTGSAATIAKWASLGLMGAGAAADSVIESKDRGMSDGTSLFIGTLAGAIEILSESFSLEKLLSPNRVLDSDFWYIAKNALAEGSEEAVSSVGNWLVDIFATAVTNEPTKFRQLQQDVQEGRASYWDIAKEVVLDFLGGAFSGSIMGSGGVVIDNARQARTGKAIKNSPNAASWFEDRWQAANQEEAAGSLYQKTYDKILNSRRYANQISDSKDLAGVISDIDTGRLYDADLYTKAQRGEADYLIQSVTTRLAEGKQMDSEDVQNDIRAIKKNEEAVRELARRAGVNDDNLFNLKGKEKTAATDNVVKEALDVVNKNTSVVYKESANIPGASPEVVELVRTLYEGTQDPNEFIDAASQIVQAALSGGELTQEMQLQNEVLAPYQVDGLFKAARNEYIRENFDEESARAIRLRSGLQGYDGQSTGGQSQGMEETPSSAEFREDVAGFKGGRKVNAIYSGAISPQEMGIAGGSTVRNLRVVQSTTNEDILKSKAMTESLGLKFVGFVGNSLEVNGVKSRGLYVPPTYNADGSIKTQGAVYVRCDHKILKTEQLTRHELMHYKIESGQVDLAKTRDAMIKRLGVDKFQEVVQDYVALYDGSGLSEEAIFKEMICDAAGNMNEMMYRGHWNAAKNSLVVMKSAKEDIQAGEGGVISSETQNSREVEPGDYLPQTETEEKSWYNGDSTSYGIDQNGHKFSLESMDRDIIDGKFQRDLQTVLKWTPTQVNEFVASLNQLMDFIKPNRDILDLNEDYTRDNRPYSPYKPNSDPLYKISLDYSTLCRKRLMTQYIIEKLQLREHRPMSGEEQIAIRDMLKEYRQQEKGLQVACAMCYVEAARLKSPDQMNRYFENPEPVLKNYFAQKNKAYKKKVEALQAQWKVDHGYKATATKDQMKKDKRGNGAADVEALNEYSKKVRQEYDPERDQTDKKRMAKELAAIAVAKDLSPDNYLSAKNLAKLKENKVKPGVETSLIYDAYTSHIRSATRSKGLETDVPYYYGDSKRKGGPSKKFIENVNKENGMRFSSWSDFQFTHLLDQMMAIIDLSVRKAAMHGYTKFPEQVRIFGKTGAMFNMSGVSGGTGFNPNGSLYFSPTESIDFEEAKKLRDQFPDTAGLQCIGINEEHTRALLRSAFIDYVIPYHVSGLNATLRKMAGIDNWKDYSAVQEERIDNDVKFDPAKHDKDNWHKAPVFSEFFDKSMYTDPAWKGKGVEAMRAAAEEYKRLCRERGMRPKFEEYTDEDNYWKLLIDRKMVNQKTGDLIQQRPVTPDFDFDVIKQEISDYVSNYNPDTQENAFQYIVDHWDQMPERIETLKREGAVEKNIAESAKREQRLKDAEKRANTLGNEMYAAAPKGVAAYKFSREFDSEGKKLTEPQAAFFKDSKARDENGNLLTLFHGTQHFGFTKFRNGRKGEASFFTPTLDVASAYAGIDYVTAPDEPLDFETLRAAYENYDVDLQHTDGVYKVVDGDEEKTFKELKDAQAHLLEQYVSYDFDVSGIYPVYLNLKNPYVFDAEERSWNQIPNFDEVDRTYASAELLSEPDDGLYEIEYIEDGGDPVTETFSWDELKKKFGSKYAQLLRNGDYIHDVFLDKNGQEVKSTTDAWASWAEQNGYDGVIFKNIYDGGDEPGDVYVSFNPEQVKSIYNQNPTENPDIRYSREFEDQYNTYAENMQSRVVNGRTKWYNSSGTRSQQAQEVIRKGNAHEPVTLEDTEFIPEIRWMKEHVESFRKKYGVKDSIDIPGRREKLYSLAEKAFGWGSYDEKTGKFTGPVATSNHPRLDIVIGLPGSGKSSVYTNEISRYYKSRVLDTDEYRDLIDLFDGPNSAFVHEEASEIRDILRDYILANKQNVILSTLGKNVEQVIKNSKRFVEEGYEVYLHLNELSVDQSVARSISRFVKKDGSLGRAVFPENTFKIGNGPTETYLALTGQKGNYHDIQGVGQVRGGAGEAYLGDRRQDAGRGTYGAVQETSSGVSEEIPGWFANALKGYDWFNNDVKIGENPIYRSEYSRNGGTLEAKGIASNYQLSREFGESELYAQNRQLRQDLSEMRQQLKQKTQSRDYWRGQTKTTEGRQLRQDDVEKLSRMILKEQDSSADAKSIAAKLKAAGEYLLNSQEDLDVVYSNARDMMYEVAHDIAAETKVLKQGGSEDFFDDLKATLTKDKVYIPPSVRKELDVQNWNEWRGSLKGMLNATATKDNGVSIEQLYNELRQEFGEWLMPEVTSETDMLREIQKAYDTYQPLYENLSGNNMAEAVETIANDLLGRIIGDEIRETQPTYADRMEKRLAKQKEKAQTALKKARADRDTAVQNLKQHYKDVAADKRAKRIDSENRTRLLHIAQRLNNRKLTRVQRALLDQYIGELDLVSKSLTNKTISDLSALEGWYHHYEDSMGKDFIRDPFIEKKLERLSNKHINDLTQEEVADLTTVLLNIEALTRTENELVESKIKADTYAAGLQTIENIRNSNGRPTLLDKYIVNETLSPERMARKLTGYNENDPLYTTVKELSDGQRKMLAYQRLAEKRFEKWTKDKRFVKEIAGQNAKEITVEGTVNGERKKLTITPAMRMSLYLHMQADDNMTHIAYGGVKIPDMKLYKQGKLEAAYDNATKATFTRGELLDITSKMTEKEKAFADAVSLYYNTMSRDSINEVSEILKGYGIAGVEKYYPIDTDGSFIKKEFDSIKKDGSIEGMGILKERIEGAKTPIMLYDMNSTLTRSISQHSKYYGLAIPVRNFNKLYGVTLKEFETSVVETLKKEWSSSAVRYLEKMMTDIQNGTGLKTDVWGNLLSKIRSKYAGAVLTTNASVAMKQAASYPTAAAVVGWRPLLKALKDTSKIDLDQFAEYTPLLWYRSKGFATPELGEIGQSGGHIPKALNWIQGIDIATTRKLVKAAMYYVTENNKTLLREQGKDAYYREVARVYNRIIEETQPNYTMMQRPQILRSDNALVRALSMFKTQPFQNFNILYDAFGNLSAKRQQYKASGTKEAMTALKEARSTAARAVGSQLVSAFVFSLMQYAWDAFRGKDKKYKDKDDETTLASWLKGMGINVLSSAGGMIPFGGYALELGEAMTDSVLKAFGSDPFFDQKFYGLSENASESMNDMGNAMINMITKIAQTLESGEITESTVRSVVDSAADFAQFAGVPANNVIKLAQAIARNVILATEKDKYIAEYKAMRLTTDPTKYKSDYYKLLNKAVREAPESYKKLYDMMLEDKDIINGDETFGTDAKSPKENIDSRIKDWGYDVLDDVWHNDPSAYAKTREKMINLYGDPFATSSKTAAENIDAKARSWEKEKLESSAEYQKQYETMTRSSIWKQATDAQRETATNNLMQLALQMAGAGNSTGENLQKKVDAGKSEGLSSTDYILYKLALQVVDQPAGESGHGSYNKAEKEEAYRMLTGKSGDDNPWK